MDYGSGEPPPREREDVALLARAFCETGTVVSDWQVELALDWLEKHLIAAA